MSDSKLKDKSCCFNVYDWMNSRDVAAYNHKIGHKFNVMETAYLISENYTATLHEKWEAYQWIIDHMPDMPVERRNNCGPYDSFHQTLNKHMALTKMVLEEFQSASADSVYTYRVYEDPALVERWFRDRDLDHTYYDSEINFRNYEECLDAIRNEILEDEDGIIRHFDVTKRQIYGDWRNGRYISVEIDRDLNVRGIADHVNLGLSVEDAEVLDLFDAIWVDVPVPFKRGEVVYADETEYGRRPKPFSLWNTANQDNGIRREDVDKKKRWADSMDMTAYGLWMDQNVKGTLYWECMHAYHNLEYYREPLEGYDRILKVIERFYAALNSEDREQFDMSHVLNAYRYIMLEEERKGVEIEYGFELKAIGVMPEAPASGAGKGK